MSQIIVCPRCGKKFIKNTQSIYKLKKKNGVNYYCGYNCWVAEDTRAYNWQKGEYVN